MIGIPYQNWNSFFFLVPNLQQEPRMIPTLIAAPPLLLHSSPATILRGGYVWHDRQNYRAFHVFRGLFVCMDENKLRAWRSHRQGLDGRLAGKSAAEVLEQTGWARSVGGVGPYLTFHARAGIGREGADAAVARVEIHELPSARGCTYVVPASDFALALKVGQGFGDEMKTVLKLGVTNAEIDKLCAQVIKSLEHGSLEPEELRKAAGGAVRNLGEEGKKRGLTTTLPVALGRLQACGEIHRISTNGRIDQQRYRYALWHPNPLSRFKLTAEEAYTELALRFFRWIGPATLTEFQWFSGLGVKAARDAVHPLRLAPLEKGDDRLMLPQLRADFQAYQIPGQPQYVLVSSLDNISHLRRDVSGLLAPADIKRSVFCEKGLMDLASHAILDRGRLIGLWEYDVAAESIAWLSFVPGNKILEKTVAMTEELVRTELGDARSFSLDSPKSRTPRITALRQAGLK
jgi:hypothetical protein